MYIVLTWIRDIRKELVGSVKTSDRRQIFGLLNLHKGFFGFSANGYKPGAHGLKPGGRFYWNFFLIFWGFLRGWGRFFLNLFFILQDFKNPTIFLRVAPKPTTTIVSTAITFLRLLTIPFIFVIKSDFISFSNRSPGEKTNSKLSIYSPLKIEGNKSQIIMIVTIWRQANFEFKFSLFFMKSSKKLFKFTV